MTNALAVVAHHDDHVIWMGGTILRTAAKDWHWTLIAMFVPEHHTDYFYRCTTALGFAGSYMRFSQDQGTKCSPSMREQMRNELVRAIAGQRFDYVFTHSRHEHGEYGGHANHDDVRDVTLALAQNGELGCPIRRVAHFHYNNMYAAPPGWATVALGDAASYLYLVSDLCRVGIQGEMVQASA